MTQAEFLAHLLEPYDSETIAAAMVIYHNNMAIKADLVMARRAERKAERRDLNS